MITVISCLWYYFLFCMSIYVVILHSMIFDSSYDCLNSDTNNSRKILARHLPSTLALSFIPFINVIFFCCEIYDVVGPKLFKATVAAYDSFLKSLEEGK